MALENQHIHTKETRENDSNVLWRKTGKNNPAYCKEKVERGLGQSVLKYLDEETFASRDLLSLVNIKQEPTARR